MGLSAVPGMTNGGVVIQSPSSLPAGTYLLMVSASGVGEFHPLRTVNGNSLLSTDDLVITIGTIAASVGCVIGNGTDLITVGQSATIVLPFAFTVTGWTIVECSDTPISSSIVVDVWNDTYANYPPTVADTIAGSAKPTLSSATKNQTSTLTGWTTAVAAGSIIKFNVDSITSAKRIMILLTGTRTS